MNSNLQAIKVALYDKCHLEISDLKLEPESEAYNACQFKLNGRNILSRCAKTTPKKAGQFVTCWKRNRNGPIEPFDESDSIDFYAITVQTEQAIGQFVFPRSILLEKGIISTYKREGKRGFRVYPIWDTPKSKQAQLTQQWQLGYFYEIDNTMDLKKVIDLHKAQ